MRYRDDLIEEIRAKNDIVDIIGESVRLKPAGANYVGLCPFHNEKTPSFSVSRNKQMYYCFGCHEGGNVITFVMQYFQYTFTEAIEYLAGRAGVELPKQSLSKKEIEEEDRKSLLYEIQKKAAGYFYYLLHQDTGKTALSYLQRRGLTEETIRRFGLGYADKYSSDLYRYLKNKGYADDLLNDSGLFTFSEKHGTSDKFWNRVMFPITNVQGKVIGFGGRVLGDGNPKYLNSPETVLFNKRRHLYALHFARTARSKKIILCEGYMDVISLHQEGFTNAVASLGTALTEQQAALLKRYTKEAVLLYDSDNAGMMAAERAIPILKAAGIESRVVDLTPYKDPDEFLKEAGADALRERVDGAGPAFLFQIANLAKEYDRSDPQMLTEFQHKVAQRLTQFPEELERTNYLKAVARTYRIDERALTRLVNTEAMRGTEQAIFRPQKTAEVPGREKKDPLNKAQKLMLTYLVNNPGAYEATKDLIGPSDFPDPLIRSIAEEVYAGIRDGTVNEARLLNRFPDAETQSEVAGIFHEELEVRSEKEQDQAFTDIVLKLWTASNEEEIRSWDGTDQQRFRELIETKKQIEEFRKSGQRIHIPFDPKERQEV